MYMSRSWLTVIAMSESSDFAYGCGRLAAVTTLKNGTFQRCDHSHCQSHQLGHCHLTIVLDINKSSTVILVARATRYERFQAENQPKQTP